MLLKKWFVNKIAKKYKDKPNPFGPKQQQQHIKTTYKLKNKIYLNPKTKITITNQNKN